jgi:zinc protease
MIDFTSFRLDNGLKVIIHHDNSTPLAAINLLYDAGSRDENPERTGMAHLLEHLMFGGSVNIPSYDKELGKAQGENNAFTNNDITNYYIQLPAQNIETGLWLESDRMLGLNITRKGLDTQKNVVIEEYKQRYLNLPYGDMWLLLRPLAYKVHPYRWPAIGSDISHVENATIEEIQQFHHEYYCPSNAILTITGNVNAGNCIDLVEKWFGPIERRKRSFRDLPGETSRGPNKLEVTRNVPYDEIVIAFHMCGRQSPGYHVTDLISDMLAGGKSSRFYRELVMGKKLFSNLNAYITGDIDPGLFIIRGRLIRGIETERGHAALLHEIDRFTSAPPGIDELDKVKNKLEATRQYNHTDILHKAMDLAFYDLLGDASGLNNEIRKYREISPGQVCETARSLFEPSDSSTLFYYSNQKN